MPKLDPVNYISEPTLSKFHMSKAFYRGVRGPVGSGKSTGCCWDLWANSNMQAHSPDGLRKTRHAIIRNTYRELEDTTLKSFMDWFPEEKTKCRFNNQSMTYPIKYGDIDAEFLFRALDRPQDVKKLLSLELTSAWINEAKEVPKAVVDVLGDRVGRYPAIRDGGCTRAGLIMDTNSMDNDHWWHAFSEIDLEQLEKMGIDPEDLKKWEFFSQPGGLIEKNGMFVNNPHAENKQNLPVDYYIDRKSGKKKDYIRVYYCNQYGFVQDGKPVHPDYNDAVHCVKQDIKPVSSRPIVIGLDFGLTPAAVLMQQLVTGQWVIFDECVTDDMGIKRFAKTKLKPMLDGLYSGFTYKCWGDPAGDDRAQTDESTCFQMLDVVGIKAKPAPYQDPAIRRESLSEPLTRMIDGKPGIIISHRCRTLRKALAGGFCYKRVQVAGDDRYHDKPDKNQYSHVAEACEYGLVGEGEGKALVSKPVQKPKPKQRSLIPQPQGWMGA